MSNELKSSSSSQLQKLIAEKSVIILLLNLKDSEDNPGYAYFAIQADKAAHFLKLQAQKATELEKHGIILYQGEGESPPDDVRAWFAHEYGLAS